MSRSRNVLALLAWLPALVACQGRQPTHTKSEGVYFEVGVDGVSVEVVKAGATSSDARHAGLGKQALFTLSADEQDRAARGLYSWPPVYRYRSIISSALGEAKGRPKSSMQVHVHVDDRAHPVLFDRLLEVLADQGWRRAVLSPTSGSTPGQAMTPFTLSPLAVSRVVDKSAERCLCLKRTIVVTERGYELRLGHSVRWLDPGQASACERLPAEQPFNMGYAHEEHDPFYIALVDDSCPALGASRDLTPIIEALDQIERFAPWCPDQHIKVEASSTEVSFRRRRRAMEAAYAAYAAPVEVRESAAHEVLCSTRLSLEEVEARWPFSFYTPSGGLPGVSIPGDP